MAPFTPLVPLAFGLTQPLFPNLSFLKIHLQLAERRARRARAARNYRPDHVLTRVRCPPGLGSSTYQPPSPSSDRFCEFYKSTSTGEPRGRTPETHKSGGRKKCLPGSQAERLISKKEPNLDDND
ncbi:hypothetical protein MTP99_009828 [Tenebrio molitor]|jgi:hypothetical protein|nr:hypothetical protein MTP99_009828 [Tenebrio molitor]